MDYNLDENGHNDVFVVFKTDKDINGLTNDPYKDVIEKYQTILIAIQLHGPKQK